MMEENQNFYTVKTVTGKTVTVPIPLTTIPASMANMLGFSQLLQGQIAPPGPRIEFSVGKLSVYIDGSLRYEDEIISPRKQLKDLCMFFMRKHKILLNLDDIKDEIIDSDKRGNSYKYTISKYVSELHTILKACFGKPVIFNQKGSGWVFDTTR